MLRPTVVTDLLVVISSYIPITRSLERMSMKGDRQFSTKSGGVSCYVVLENARNVSFDLRITIEDVLSDGGGERRSDVFK